MNTAVTVGGGGRGRTQRQGPCSTLRARGKPWGTVTGGAALSLSSLICSAGLQLRLQVVCQTWPLGGLQKGSCAARTRVWCHTLRPWGPPCWGQVMKPDPEPESWAACLSATLPRCGWGSDIWLTSPAPGPEAGPTQPVRTRASSLEQGWAFWYWHPLVGEERPGGVCPAAPPLPGLGPSSFRDPQPLCPHWLNAPSISCPRHLL